MHRIDDPNNVASMPTPQAVGPKPNAFYKRAVGIKGTDVQIDFLNSLQEEVCNVIEDSGFTLDKEDHTQLLVAIQYIIDNSVIIPPPPPGSFILDVNDFDITSTGTAGGPIASGGVGFFADGTTGIFTVTASNIIIPKNLNRIDGNNYAIVSFPLGTGDIKGMYGSTDYQDYNDIFDNIALTEKAVVDLLDWSIERQNVTYEYGAYDGSLAFPNNYKLWGGIANTGGREYMWSPMVTMPVDAVDYRTNTVLDVWVEPAPGVGESYTINGITISDTDTHGQIEVTTGWAAVTTLPTTKSLSVGLSSGAATLTRVNYRLITQYAFRF